MATNKTYTRKPVRRFEKKYDTNESPESMRETPDEETERNIRADITSAKAGKAPIRSQTGQEKNPHATRKSKD